MDSLVRSVSSYPAITILDPGGYAGAVSSSDTFAMYLFTNGAEKIFGGPEALDAALGLDKTPYDTILGLNITDIVSTPSLPEEKDEIEGIIGGDENGSLPQAPEKADAEKFYSDIEKALPFSVAEEKEKEVLFSDMYVPSAANGHALSEAEKESISYEDYTERHKSLMSLFDEDPTALRVPVGAGGLPVLMAEILRSVSEGGSLEDVLWEQIDGYGQTASSDNADLFWIDTESGRVLGAGRFGRTVADGEWKSLFDDDDAVLKAADDLESFIRYAVFPIAGDDPERVKEFLQHLMNKQAYADYARFILDLDPDADINGVMELIKANLTAAGIMSGALGGEKEPDNGNTLTPEKELAELLESAETRSDSENL